MKICPVCYSKSTVLWGYAKDVRNSSSDRKYDYYICDKCGSLFLTKMMVDQSFYNKYYGQSYYETKKGIKSFLETLYAKFVNFSKFKAFHKLFKNKKKVRVLDVGAGNLNFLESIKEPKFDRYGIDIFAFAVNERGNIHVINDDFLKHNFGQLKFDLITSWHVIEHISDSRKFLKKIYQLLKNDGIAIISTPNLDSFGFKWFKKDWYHFDAPRHLVLFKELSLKRLVKDLGFKNITSQNMFYEFPFDLWHSANKLINIKRITLFLLYPLLKLFGHETVTLTLRK